jgi:DNA-binding HxlR family transcriptional regulator
MSPSRLHRCHDPILTTIEQAAATTVMRLLHEEPGWWHQRNVIRRTVTETTGATDRTTDRAVRALVDLGFIRRRRFHYKRHCIALTVLGRQWFDADMIRFYTGATADAS